MGIIFKAKLSTFSTHFSICILFVWLICHLESPVDCEEVGIDSQSVSEVSSVNSTADTAANQTWIEPSPSNKYPSANSFPVSPYAVPPPTLRGSAFYGKPRRPESFRPQYIYRPRIHLEPVEMDHLADASRHIVGEIMSGVSTAFHNLFSQPRPRSSLSQLNGESIIATASRLLPATTKLLARNSSPRVADLHIEATERTANGTSNQDKVHSLALPSAVEPVNYDLEGQRLRQDIVSKVGHLQTVLTTAMEVSRERRDLITRRILEQTNYRLEQAKARADRILSEPANSQIAVRTLYAINQGINGIHSFLHGLLDRINISINFKLADPVKKEEQKPTETNKTVNIEADQETGEIATGNS